MSLAITGMLSACATGDKLPQHGQTQVRESVQQVPTDVGPKFVDCTVSYCPQRTAKTIGWPEVKGQETPVVQQAVDVKPAVPSEPASSPTSPTLAPQEKVIGRAIVHFAWNSAVLSAQEKAKLAQLGPLMANATRVRVVGRTDATGPGDANDRLANQRALAVMLQMRDVLVSVEKNRVAVQSKGLCCYIAENKSKSGRSLNRRAEVEIYGTSDIDPSKDN
ncbi:OmpA family protein [Aquabacterium sp. NJ1]|uniref:OmpA family protein n=1 Tax=Aquabacterium sp. NJ1 TaxID=1538295 RepID=UPI001377EC83|nr:OmpA family protein [Aquabacterium sp. NJ1]